MKTFSLEIRRIYGYKQNLLTVDLIASLNLIADQENSIGIAFNC